MEQETMLPIRRRHPMTRIRATCPGCGEVDLRPDDIHLEIVRAEDGRVSDGSTYRFACPACTDLVTKPADERIVRLLSSGGVAVSVRQPTATVQVSRPRPALAAPPLTYDDLLDFHFLLQTEDWFDGPRRIPH